MRGVGTAVAVVLTVVVGCSSGGGGGTSRTFTDPTGTGIGYDTAIEVASCPAQTQACGASGWCCPTGTACLSNPADQYGCGTGYCCLAGCAGSPCGTGCCGSGTSCVANPGGTTGCSGDLCCATTPDEACPIDVEAQCADGTRCLLNHSARACAGSRFACYLPAGEVGCPGEVLCPNGVDFCPGGTACMGWSGVCENGSTSGNYCCKAAADQGESCDVIPCKAGLTCVTNPHCANSDPSATHTCKAPCGGSYPVDCGTYCCSSSYPICDAPDTCMCWVYY